MDCWNNDCRDHDVEYGSSCSSFYRHSFVTGCPNYKPYAKPDMTKYLESAARAKIYLDDIENSGKNGAIVSGLRELLATRKSLIFQRHELESILEK